VLFVESAELQAVKFQGEARTHFLKVGAGTVLVEFVSVVAEENEVSLVVHRDYAPAPQLRLLRE